MHLCASVAVFRSLFNILRSFLTSQNFQYPFRASLNLWRYIHCHFLCGVVGESKSTGKPQRRHDARSARQPSCGESGGINSKSAQQIDNPDTKNLRCHEEMEFCASREPRSSLRLDVDHQILEVDGLFIEPASIGSVNSDASPPHTQSMLDPGYHLSHPEVSQISQDSTRAGRANSAGDNPHSMSTVEEWISLEPRSRTSAEHISRIASAGRPGTPPPSQHSSSIQLHVQPVSEAAGGSAETTEPTTISIAPPSLSHRTTPPLSYRSRNVYPILAIRRYDRNVILERAEPSFTIEPVTISYELRGIPQGWTACAHPEGALYFYHQDKHTFTDANLCDENVLGEIKAFMKRMDEEMDERREDCARLSSHDCDLVLELEDDGNDGYNWCYYFVDHTEKILVWLHEYELTWELDSVKGAITLAHLKHEIRSKYWYHVEMFPYNRNIPKTDFEELMSTLAYFDLDQMTSLASTVAHTVDELDRMLTLTERLQAVVGNNDYVACSIGRMMCLLEHHRYMNFYGQYGARLCRNQSLVGRTQNSRTMLISTLAPFLLNAPNSHLQSLGEVWIDGMIIYSSWSQFMRRLQGEWQTFIIYSGVLLNANMAFLTIPNPAIENAPAWIFCYVSIITSIGSVLVGLILIRQNTENHRETADDAAYFLSRQNHPILGLETLAIIFSLPSALLMWGIFTFLLAFAFLCFNNRDEATIITTAIAWLSVGGLVIWSVSMPRGRNANYQLAGAGAKIKNVFTSVKCSIREHVELIRDWICSLQSIEEPIMNTAA